ncbi:spatacsin [Synchiropus picturatus]
MLQDQSVQVALVPENRYSGPVADLQKAQLSPGGSLLCSLEVGGGLSVWDPRSSGTSPARAEGVFSDFNWQVDKDVGSQNREHGISRLLAVGSQCSLKLIEVLNGSSVSFQSIYECTAGGLLQRIQELDQSVCELQSLLLLQSVSGQCCVLVNSVWLLQLHLRDHLEIVTCCRIHLRDNTVSVHHSVHRDTLFVLSTCGLISVFNVCEGRPLAYIDLHSSIKSDQTDDDPSSSFVSSPPISSSAFCLLQVSADLNTLVAITEAPVAIAVDLNDYFRRYPDHLLAASPPTKLCVQPTALQDEDSVCSSNCSLSALGFSFTTDRSWEARLASLYPGSKQRLSATSKPPMTSTSWCSSLPHLAPLLASSSVHSRVPCGAATAAFSISDMYRPSVLSVSDFSAMLTFVSPGNTHITLALWEFESGAVSYHQVKGGALPIQCCGEKHPQLLLTDSGLSQVLFSMSQQDLLSRLMLFGSASTVDAVCHLNSWGRCSIPFHALQAGLKNRQLDTVDFYLKSKENSLKPPTSMNPADQSEASSVSLPEAVQELRPALDLLCSAVRDSNSDAQSRQFAEQLLNITMNFINTQIRSLLSDPHYEDVSVKSCVEVLDRYVTELRKYMKKYPWPRGDDISRMNSQSDQIREQDEWEFLSTEEVVRRSILTNQIPRAQVVLRRQSKPEQHLSALRTEGLHQVFKSLQQRELQTANTLLTNMGFNVKKQLHKICLHTNDKQLREFVVEELTRRRFFLEEETQSVLFIREMEKLGSLPPSRRHGGVISRSVGKMDLVVKSAGEVLEELLVRKECSVDQKDLWQMVRLDWVKNWDQSSRTAILLSRRDHTELEPCDAALLWQYLTSLHDQNKVVDWIQSSGLSGSSQWPDLAPEVVNSSTVCSYTMREKILDLLARRGVFIPDELSDLEQLLWRLSQGEGVMSSSPIVPQLRSPIGLDLHSLVINFCVDHNLQYLLYTYLEHYRLTPRNCPVLTSPSGPGSHPWCEMLIKVQEISRDLTDPGLVFQASLTSAQVLLPGGQSSLSSLLFEGHSLLALATIMFAPGGIDQVVVQGAKSSRTEKTVDPQLLKMALATHPKLRSALFPSGPRGGPSYDVSVYHLLQSLHPLDPSRLFGWQSANTLSSTETTELPHFSSPHLVNRFALIENLDFLFYLRHGRPSFAFATFLVQQLSDATDVKLLLQQAFKKVYKLALQCFHTASVTSAAVCFCELLGVCSLQLRVDVKVLNTILQHWDTQGVPTSLHTLVSKGVKLAEGDPGVAKELVVCLEAAVTDILEQKGISRSSYEASQEWALPVQFCQIHSLTLSSVYPSHCAMDGQFIHFLLFVQLHNFPPQQVRSLSAQFGPALQDHLSLAFQELQLFNQSGHQSPESEPETLLSEEVSEKEEQPRELFQVLLLSQQEASPFRYLLEKALVQRCPTLAVLAACQEGAELLPCLCLWILTSVDDVSIQEATSHLPVGPQHHDWSLHDLSFIWKTLLERGLVRPLLRGFELFYRDCPLVLVLRMFELCCDFRNFPAAKLKLLEFQRMLIALRNGSPAPLCGLPLQWVESQASVLLFTMLQRCSSQFDLHRLLQLLADVDRLLKSNGPDFKKLSQLSQVLHGSDVSVPPRLLQSSSPSVQQEEFQATVDALQTLGRFTQARQVAVLAGLPIHRLLLNQLLQEVNAQKARRQWGRLETRVAFWKKCHDQLKSDASDPELAAQFFLSQTVWRSEGRSSTESTELQSELLDVQERCLLLVLSAHWISLQNPVPLKQLEELEKKLWSSRVRQHVIKVAMEKESVFNLPSHMVLPDANTYEVLMKKFSFSTISEMNSDSWLSMDGLPGPSEDSVTDSELNHEERSILVVKVGLLLDSGSIHEASRVCRYFSMHQSDLWVVLRCRGLASGEVQPEPCDQPEEEPNMRRIVTSPSFSSLSSFVMLPLPDDDVAIQLQKLVDQCRHGNNYCKQVLSLYQLSKELQCPFTQICQEDPRLVLEKLLLSDQPERFRKAQAFIKTQGFSTDTVAQLVSSAVVQALLDADEDLQTVERQVFRPSEGRDSLMQLIKLCDDPNLVGVKLMENINGVSLRDLNCIVELLIVAHDCFSLTCNMVGIVRVLQAARHLSHTYLAPGEHYSLLVRLLTGVGRYDEMTYIFDLLIQNHAFELLLRKKFDTARGQSSSLKTALLDYLKRCLPADSEKHNMVALCFSMRREIGENHEMAARTQLRLIDCQAWVVTPDLKDSLAKALGLLRDAAKSFFNDSCVRQATRCVQLAKLVALQLHFLNQDCDLRVINLRPEEMLEAMMAQPRCYQVLVLSEAYGVSPDWAEILYQKVILNGDFGYLEELKHQRPLTSSLFEEIFRKLEGAPSAVTPNVKRLLTHCDDVYCRYRLAYQQNLYDVTKSLLQDAKTSAYLSDRLAS